MKGIETMTQNEFERALEFDSVTAPGSHQPVRDKLIYIMGAMSECGMGFETFIKAWMGMDGRNGQRAKDLVFDMAPRYNTVTARRRAFERVANDIVECNLYRPVVLSADSLNVIARELDALIDGEMLFGKLEERHLDERISIEKIDFAAGYRAIRSSAPNWYHFFSTLLVNQRAHQLSHPEPKHAESSFDHRLFTTTVIACNARARNRSNFIHSLIDMHLMGHGIKARVIDVLAGLGICHTYAQANTNLNRLEERSELTAKREAKKVRLFPPS
jgi:hypothetical protein